MGTFTSTEQAAGNPPAGNPAAGDLTQVTLGLHIEQALQLAGADAVYKMPCCLTKDAKALWEAKLLELNASYHRCHDECLKAKDRYLEAARAASHTPELAICTTMRCSNEFTVVLNHARGMMKRARNLRRQDDVDEKAHTKYIRAVNKLDHHLSECVKRARALEVFEWITWEESELESGASRQRALFVGREYGWHLPEQFQTWCVGKGGIVPLEGDPVDPRYAPKELTHIHKALLGVELLAVEGPRELDQIPEEERANYLKLYDSMKACCEAKNIYLQKAAKIRQAVESYPEGCPDCGGRDFLRHVLHARDIAYRAGRSPAGVIETNEDYEKAVQDLVRCIGEVEEGLTLAIRMPETNEILGSFTYP